MVFETVFEWILADPLRVGAAALTLMVILFSGGMWAGSVNNDRKAFKAAFARVDAKIDAKINRILGRLPTPAATDKTR